MPRIYVASLSDYNAGRLHGVWIDLEDKDRDEIWAEINTMLANSPEARAFPIGGLAEEWAIHDYEGFFGYQLSEYESIDRVIKIAKFLDEHGEAGIAFLSNDSSMLELDEEDLEEAFTEAYAGYFDDEKAYAYDRVLEFGFPSVGLFEKDYEAHREKVDALYSFIDWEQVAHELLMDGWSHIDSEHNLHVFQSR